jgi:electron transfer flavoprotein alpha subunit
MKMKNHKGRHTQSHNDCRGVWVFGDYRNYFQNRVTLQLIAKAKQLATELRTEVTVLVLGDHVHQYAMEYVAHGADVVVVVDHPSLKDYHVEIYTRIVDQLVRHLRPEIFLTGATAFGREFFPRLAKRLATGLSADCVSLEVDEQTGLLIQTTPAFGGELLADVVTPEHRPQMATVHPGIFSEIAHQHGAMARIVYPEVEIVPDERVELIDSRPEQVHKGGLEEAPVVLVGGRGLGSEKNFRMLFEVAELLGGDVGATRPVIKAGWAENTRLLGQTGKSVKPKLLISIGTSGALQYTTGIQGAENIVAINRDPHAPIFNLADLGLVGDAKAVLSVLLEQLRKRL